MARRITTAASGTSGAGITEAQVNTLIQDKVGYEYIDSVVVSSAISSISVTKGIDNSIYDGYLYDLRNLSFSSSNMPFYFNVLNQTLGQYSTTYAIHRVSSSDSFSYGTSSTVYWDGSVNFGTSTNLTGYVEVDLSSLSKSAIVGRAYLSYSPETSRWYDGGFRVSSASAGFGGVSFGQTFAGSGRIDIYGKRKKA